MSAFGPRKLTGRRVSGAGGCDGCNGTDHDDDVRDRYADFGPTLACEKLWECHGIRLAKETVRKLIRRSATSRQRGRISNAMASRTWHRIEMAHVDARLRATGR
ncbi:hypothetical protein [Burkholderia aenigmatica]